MLAIAHYTFHKLVRMKSPLYLLLHVLVTATLFSFLPTVARAQTVTYDFAQFTPGQATPLLNVAPDVGSSSFEASFTSNPNTAAFVVLDFLPNGLFSGNSLVEQTGVLGNTLTVTLNTAVNFVSLAFATNGPGTLTFASAAGSMVVASTAQIGAFPGGTLVFDSAVAFSSFTVTAGPGPEFAIDNLTMRIAAATGVPDNTSTIVILGFGALLLCSVASGVGINRAA